MDLKESILEAAIRIFNEKGLKLTMDDIAKDLRISKKTIYTVFKDKHTLFCQMVDYLFDSIRESEDEIIKDNSLGTVEKLKKEMSVMPQKYKDIDFTQLYLLKEKYPDIYARVEYRLGIGWEKTFELIEKGINEGVIRNVNLELVQMMLMASIEQFFQKDILVKNKMTYQEALNSVVDIIIKGIVCTSD